MSTEIELRIPKTSSSNLAKALAIARTFEAFTEPTQKRHPYRLVVGPEELCSRHRDLEQLYTMARSWKGTQLRISGRHGDRNALRTALTVFQCADQKASAVIPENFCQPKYEHGWGCKRLTMIQEGRPRYLYEPDRGYGYWFRFGSFTEDRTVWNVDKKKLLDALGREASSRHVDMCPHFDPSVVEERVNALPDSIEPGEGSAWDVQFEEKYDNSTIQKVPIGIKPREVDDHRGRDPSISLTTQAQEEEEHERNRNIPEVSFDDIGGVDEIIGMVREVIELPLRHPALFRHLGIAPHKGILLYGPPGCGKTLIAKAIANEIQAHFVSIRGPELFTKWFGQSEENLRAVFAEARKFAPSVIFFDEIDAIAQKRSSEECVRHQSVFVNQLLSLMDGMETYENVCVIASTNRPELLDEAIVRPGRFDYTLEIKHPSVEGCRKIFEIHTREMPLAPCVDTDRITSQMRGFSGAEIAFAAREGAYNCLRRCADVADWIAQDQPAVSFDGFVVEQCDFEKALKMICSRSAGPYRGGS